MSTRRTSPKDSLPAKSDEKPFLDLSAIDEKALAETAKKILADVKREGKAPLPVKRDPKKDEEYERMLTRLFGGPTSKEK